MQWKNACSRAVRCGSRKGHTTCMVPIRVMKNTRLTASCSSLVSSSWAVSPETRQPSQSGTCLSTARRSTAATKLMGRTTSITSSWAMTTRYWTALPSKVAAPPPQVAWTPKAEECTTPMDVHLWCETAYSRATLRAPVVPSTTVQPAQSSATPYSCTTWPNKLLPCTTTERTATPAFHLRSPTARSFTIRQPAVLRTTPSPAALSTIMRATRRSRTPYFGRISPMKSQASMTATRMFDTVSCLA